MTVMSCLYSVLGRPWSDSQIDLNELTENLETILRFSEQRALESSNFEMPVTPDLADVHFRYVSGMRREKRSIAAQQFRSMKSSFRDNLEVRKLLSYIRGHGPKRLVRSKPKPTMKFNPRMKVIFSLLPSSTKPYPG